MELEITTLIENQQDDACELLFEHGLSLYIEFHGKKILFDTGQTGDFLKNAVKLKKSMRELDYIIISHGHYDHSGGVPRLMEHLQKAAWEGDDKTADMTAERTAGHNELTFYVGKELWAPKYKKLPDGSFHYNGNPFSREEVLQYPVSLHEIDEDITYIAEDIILFKNFERSNDFERTNPKFHVKQGEHYVQDEFSDEIALGLVTSKGLVLVVGCSHVGIVNILNAVTKRTGLPVYAILGGTHLVEADGERISKTLKAFEELGVQQIAVSHCTGDEGIAGIKKKFADGFINNNTGNVYRV